jgi:hypothetical protein
MNTAKCRCGLCSGELEFEQSMAGQTAVCPHCGMDTALYLPPVAVLAPAPEPDKAPESKLTFCPVCKGSVSPRARACPHCGEPGWFEKVSSLDFICRIVLKVWVAVVVLSLLAFFIGWQLALILHLIVQAL